MRRRTLARMSLLSWWEVPGVAAESLSTTEYKMLIAGMPRVSDCCVQMHNLVRFAMGEHPPVVSICWLLMVPWSRKGRFTGAGQCGRGLEKT